MVAADHTEQVTAISN